MVNTYSELCSPKSIMDSTSGTEPDLSQVQASALAFQETRQRATLETARLDKAKMARELRQRTNWALDTERALKEEQERRERWVKQLEDEIEQRGHEISRQLGRLEESRLDLERLQKAYDQVLASSSWRITRPLRVLRRTLNNFMRSHGWNPRRWPLLISGLVRNLSTVGPERDPDADAVRSLPGRARNFGGRRPRNHR